MATKLCRSCGIVLTKQESYHTDQLCDICRESGEARKARAAEVKAKDAAAGAAITYTKVVEIPTDFATIFAVTFKAWVSLLILTVPLLVVVYLIIGEVQQ